MRAFKFHIYKGNELIREETLALEAIKVGKLASSHLRIDDETVSRMHAVIEVNGDDVSVIDLGSVRGTKVNGERTNKASLRSGDELLFGDARVVVTFVDVSSPPPTEEAPVESKTTTEAAPTDPAAPKRNARWPTFVRIAFTTGLLVFVYLLVYRETGPATAITFALVTVAVELLVFQAKLMRQDIARLVGIVEGSGMPPKPPKPKLDTATRSV